LIKIIVNINLIIGYELIKKHLLSYLPFLFLDEGSDMGKKILIGSVLSIFLIFMMPFISAVEQVNVNQIQCKKNENDTDDKSDYFALIVGCSEYQNCRNNLPKPPFKPFQEYQMKYVYNTLINATNWEIENIVLLLNEDATKQNIINNLIELSDKIDSNDVFIFSWTGHGTDIKDENNEDEYHAAICPYDTTSEDGQLVNVLIDDDLDYYFTKINAKGQFIMFESCYSGGMVDVENHSNMAVIDVNKNGRIVVMSTPPGKLGMADYTVGFPMLYLFGMAFSDSKNDMNQDGWISAEEAFFYVDTNFPEFQKQLWLELIDFIMPVQVFSDFINANLILKKIGVKPLMRIILSIIYTVFKLKLYQIDEVKDKIIEFIESFNKIMNVENNPNMQDDFLGELNIIKLN
jgi:caspase domain-containing protein